MTDVDPARDQHASWQPGADTEVGAGVYVALLPECRGMLDDIIHLSELVRVEIVHPAYLIAPATRQARIWRSGNAVRGEVRRADGPIVDNDEVAEPMAHVGGLGG